MKNLKFLAVFSVAVFFYSQESYSQVRAVKSIQLDEAKLKKVEVQSLPEAVIESVSQYKGYTPRHAFITEEKSTKSNSKIYKVQIAKGSMIFSVLVNEKGKILETQE